MTRLLLCPKGFTAARSEAESTLRNRPLREKTSEHYHALILETLQLRGVPNIEGLYMHQKNNAWKIEVHQQIFNRVIRGYVLGQADAWGFRDEFEPEQVYEFCCALPQFMRTEKRKEVSLLSCLDSYRVSTTTRSPLIEYMTLDVGHQFMTHKHGREEQLISWESTVEAEHAVFRLLCRKYDEEKFGKMEKESDECYMNDSRRFVLTYQPADAEKGKKSVIVLKLLPSAAKPVTRKERDTLLYFIDGMSALSTPQENPNHRLQDVEAVYKNVIL